MLRKTFPLYFAVISIYSRESTGKRFWWKISFYTCFLSGHNLKATATTMLLQKSVPYLTLDLRTRSSTAHTRHGTSNGPVNAVILYCS